MPESFAAIYQRACERKGSEEALNAQVGEPLSKSDIAKISNDRFLAHMTKKVFQSGFVWRVVEQKWPYFEEAFFGFDIEKILLMPDEMLEQKATDKRIIRNYKKVRTVRDNALMIKDISQEYGCFAAFVNQFGPGNITQLWRKLKHHGTRLGGNTGPYMLRAIGVDTFLLSRDVEDYLRKNDIITGGMYSNRSLDAMDEVFFHWHEESKQPLQHISRILAMSWGTNQALP
ncbi:DNA-3-methyladenine glycosylase I [Alteromonas sp. ASW11-130]|uniref:DNA-3-methyladenine glycosylase I n=1 Tax=Alteromonas sp. ASW11-130 TaxID=3015775 RepID=UPI002242882F|nr:DNA-3-methyladenine glycosylase I [Alteromonas sp. ASW11-130]MCW8091909.1 DNA-3-methyladenine glycosylase I [Alteromonas sp. ASW11-130]